MTTPGERAALALLAELRAHGWVFSLRHDPARPSDVDNVFGSYSYGSVHDTLRLWSASEACAARVRLDVWGGVYPPRPEYLWSFTGTLCEAIDELTRLPHPDARNAPKLVLPVRLSPSSEGPAAGW